MTKELSKSELILHPLRLRILRALGSHKLTPKGLHERLPEIAQATLYRHIKLLEKASVIQVVHTEAKRGTLEKTYSLNQADLLGQDMAKASPAEWQSLFQRFSAHLLADFERYFESDSPQPLSDGVGFRQALLYLSPKELKELSQELNQVLAPYLAQKPNADRRGIAFSSILIPEPVKKKKQS